MYASKSVEAWPSMSDGEWPIAVAATGRASGRSYSSPSGGIECSSSGSSYELIAR